MMQTRPYRVSRILIFLLTAWAGILSISFFSAGNSLFDDYVNFIYGGLSMLAFPLGVMAFIDYRYAFLKAGVWLVYLTAFIFIETYVFQRPEGDWSNNPADIIYWALITFMSLYVLWDAYRLRRTLRRHVDQAGHIQPERKRGQTRL
jgi:hypothetical protein